MTAVAIVDPSVFPYKLSTCMSSHLTKGTEVVEHTCRVAYVTCWTLTPPGQRHTKTLVSSPKKRLAHMRYPTSGVLGVPGVPT